MISTEPTSAFIALPGRFGHAVRLLGPTAEQAASAIEVLAPLDQPVGAVQFCLGGVTSADGRLIEPIEVLLVLDPAQLPPGGMVPVATTVESLRDWPLVCAQLPGHDGEELLEEVLSETGSVGPLLYCRKRHTLFEARSPETGEPLTPAPPPAGDPGADPIPRLLCWDGPGDADRQPRLYGGRSMQTEAGTVAAFDQLLLDQGGVVRRTAWLAERDAGSAELIAARHPCCRCPERTRCYPEGGGYAYAADRLVLVNAAAIPMVVRPAGAWSLLEAAQIVGGRDPAELAASNAPEPLRPFRAAQAADFAARAGARWFAGESDGREVLEVLRIKLALLADVLAQLDSAWRATGRPHLCWNDQTLRAAWRPTGATSPAAWAFGALLRKIGLQPALTPGQSTAPLPFPPQHSLPGLLPLEVSEVARWFGVARGGNLVVRGARPGSGEVAIEVLLEDLNLSWELFAPGDVILVTGPEWTAELSPAATRAADDGSGLPMQGIARGPGSAALTVGAQAGGAAVRIFPRFGQAVDLHAFGVLLLETLLATDERGGQRIREGLVSLRDQITRACLAVPVAQREAAANSILTTECELDSPAALLARRSLMFNRADRARVKLDAMPPALWLATATCALRMTTFVPGFSYCDHRAAYAPRIADTLLPLAELRGLIALADDHLLGRAAPAAAVRSTLHRKK